jgi:MFS family permease
LRDLPGLFRRHRGLRWFALGNFQSAIGTGAATVGLVVIAYERAHTAWAVAAVLSANLLPTMLLSVPLGAIADRYGYRRLAVGGDVLRACAFVGIGLAHPLWLTIVSVLVFGTGTAAFSPAGTAAVPLLAGPDDAEAATSAMQVVGNVGQALGPLICVPLLAVVSAKEIMLFNGLTFLINALIITRVPLPAQRGSAREHHHPLAALIADTRAGLQIVANNRVLWSLMLLCFLLFFNATLQNIGQPLLVLGTLHGSSSTYSALIMVNEIGFAVGTLFRPTDGLLRTLLVRFLAAMLVMALAALGYALATAAWVTIVPFLLAGIGNTLVLVVVFTVYVKVTPSEFRARIIGIHVAVGTAAMVLSFLVSSVLIGALGVHGAFRLEAAGIAATLLLAVFLLRPLISAPDAVVVDVAGFVSAAAPRSIGDERGG